MSFPPVPDASRRSASRIRHFLAALAGVFLVGFLIARYAEDWGSAFRLLGRAQLSWLLAAVAAQACYYLFAGILLHHCLRLVDYRPSFFWTLQAAFLLILLSRVLPGPGATGPAALYVLLERQGVSRSRSALVGPLFFAADYAVFLTILVGSAVWLALRGGVPFPPILAVGMLVLYALATLMVVLLLRHPESARPWIHNAGRGVNWLMAMLHLQWRVSDDMVEGMARTMLDLVIRWKAHPGLRWGFVLSAVAIPLCDAATMGLLFAAFGVFLPAPSLLLGYGIATLGSIVSVLPGGIGTFEAAMVLGFDGLGAPESATLAATLVYRGIATLLPALLGVFAVRLLLHRRANTPTCDPPA